MKIDRKKTQQRTLEMLDHVRQMLNTTMDFLLENPDDETMVYNLVQCHTLLSVHISDYIKFTK